MMTLSTLEPEPVPRPGDGHTVRLIAKSFNETTGPIPVSITDPASCPPSCPLMGNGCYAEALPWFRYWWFLVAVRGSSWWDFCVAVRLLSPGQIWRHNEGGDLPGLGDLLDVGALEMLVRANRGRLGFTYTRKPLRTAAERHAVGAANAAGFTINLSAMSLVEADRLADLEVGPVTVVLPHYSPGRIRTPAGRRVVICPAETDGLTCKQCKLCARPSRKAIVGFPAHGSQRNLVTEIVRSRRVPSNTAEVSS
ncbi:MAG: hypothetical protein KF850_34175 [Labilithrix sp.]|nr:hypothetical protein [Labilithrix sp.]